MQKTKIVLNGIQDVRKFVNEVTLLDYEVDLEQGRYIVDAKSIMGIFALDTLLPLHLLLIPIRLMHFSIKSRALS